MTELDCSKLQSEWHRKICEGRSGLTPEQEEGYRQLWAMQMPGNPAADMSCVYRGEQVSTIGCAGCGGTAEIPIFACVIYEECAIANAVVPNVCTSCAERKPA